LVTKATPVDRRTTLALWLYHQHNPHMWQMAWQWCHFMLASTQDKYGQGLSMPNYVKWKLSCIVYTKLY